MSTLNLLPLGVDQPTRHIPEPPPEDPGTVRNWVGGQALPAEINLEPDAGLLNNLGGSDPASGDRLRKALGQFPHVGQEVAGFKLVAVLGRGTFGRVYLARQGDLAERYVALKVSTDLAGESRTLARLQHTNIVPIYSVHRAGPFQAVCMPFFGATTVAHLLRRFRGTTAVPATGRQLVETLKVLNGETVLPSLEPRTGDSLGSVPLNPGTGPGGPGVPDDRTHFARPSARPRGPLDQLRQASYPDAVCWIGARLADGLEHAHAEDILHNDLKPANVLITDDGQPMLLDFGVSEDLKVRTTIAGASVGGTLPYMAPEHLRSVRDKLPTTDARSDVFALGLILFEMLTGAHPFRVPTGKLEDELPQMLAERSEPPPRLRRLNPAVSPGLEAIIRKCLEPAREHRYQSAGDLRDDLDRHRAGLPLKHVRVPSVRERTQKWARRHPRLASSATLGVTAGLLLAACVVGYQARQNRLEQDRAEATARLDRSEAQVVLRGFEDERKAAQYLLTARAADPTTVEAGIARCEAALARYGLPGDDGWDRRREFQALPEDEQRQVRDQLAKTCLLLARGYSLRAKPGTDGPLADAVRLNELAVALAGDAAPRAAWDQRADVLRRLGRLDDAERAAEKAKGAPLATAEDYCLAGSEALAAGRHRDALRQLRRSLELDPGSFWTHMALGLCHEGLGQLPDAAACYTAAIAVWPNYAGGYHSRGLVSLRQRDFSRARADLDRAAELVPDAADIYLNRALAHQGLKEYKEGLADLDKAIELGAPHSRAILMRGRLKELAGDAEGAKTDLADGLRETPTDELGWINRGVARVGTDLPGALGDFDAALRLHPRSLTAMQNKAHVLSKLGRNEDAIAVLGRLVELYPDYVPARAGRGVLNARVGNDRAALADAKEALARDTSPPNLYQLAGVYALLDRQRPENRAEAIKLLTAALRAGFGHDFIETDKDLDPIRETPEFKQVLGGVRALKVSAAARQ